MQKVTPKKKKIKPLFELPKPGITKERGAYYRGDTAEAVVQKRLIEREKLKELKRSSRGASRRGSGSIRKGNTPRSHNAEVRRLERALSRRKTLAARKRIKARIRALKKELGIA